MNTVKVSIPRFQIDDEVLIDGEIISKITQMYCDIHVRQDKNGRQVSQLDWQYKVDDASVDWLMEGQLEYSRGFEIANLKARVEELETLLVEAGRCLNLPGNSLDMAHLLARIDAALGVTETSEDV